MESPETCPFCGAEPVKKIPYGDRIKRIGGSGKVSGISAEGNLELTPNPKRQEYLMCNGCDQKYVWASLDINLILNHLNAGENIAMLVHHYYNGEVTLTDLITKYRTGIVRRYSKISFLPKKIVNRQLYICFKFKEKRTFGIVVRKKKNNKYFYTMKTLGVPDL